MAIPSAIYRALKLKAGDVLTVLLENGKILFQRERRKRNPRGKMQRT